MFFLSSCLDRTFWTEAGNDAAIRFTFPSTHGLGVPSELSPLLSQGSDAQVWETWVVCVWRARIGDV